MAGAISSRWHVRLLAAVLLTVALLAGAVGPVWAESGAEAESDAFGLDPAAIERLVAAELIKGRSTGGDAPDYALDAAITRAELVTVLVRAMGGAQEAEAYEGEAALPDTAEHWSKGWVAVGMELSHEPLGYPDGTFQPDRVVTAAEAAAFTMKFLGIEPAEGAWPGNYLQGLAAVGIVGETEIMALHLVANMPAPRGLVFSLLDLAFSTYEVEEGKTVYDRIADGQAAGEATEDEAADEEN